MREDSRIAEGDAFFFYYWSSQQTYQAKDSWDCRNDGIYGSAPLEDIWLKEVGQWKRWWLLLCWCLLCPPQTCGQSIDRGGCSLSSWRPGWQQLIEKSLTPSHLPGEPGCEGDHPAPGSEPAPTGAWCGLQFIDRRSCVGPGWGGQETRNAGKSAVSFPCHFLVERPRHSVSGVLLRLWVAENFGRGCLLDGPKIMGREQKTPYDLVWLSQQKGREQETTESRGRLGWLLKEVHHWGTQNSVPSTFGPL